MVQTISLIVSGAVVIAFGFGLLAFAGLATLKPRLAESFLTQFAQTPRAHYTEQALRLVVGTALVTFAPAMWYPNLFATFGWLIIATTVALVVLPWRLHRRFANKAIPLVVQNLRLYAAGNLVLGALILCGALRNASSFLNVVWPPPN